MSDQLEHLSRDELSSLIEYARLVKAGKVRSFEVYQARSGKLSVSVRHNGVTLETSDVASAMAKLLS